MLTVNVILCVSESYILCKAVRSDVKVFFHFEKSEEFVMDATLQSKAR